MKTLLTNASASKTSSSLTKLKQAYFFTGTNSDILYGQLTLYKINNNLPRYIVMFRTEYYTKQKILYSREEAEKFFDETLG